MLSNIIIYGKPGCRDCDNAKKALSEVGLNYSFLDITIETNEVITSLKINKERLPIIFISDTKMSYPQLCTYLNNLELNIKLDNNF